MEHTPILPAGDSLSAAERFLPSIIGIEPLSAVARALAGFNREQLGSAIEVLIALMDVADGDPDLEADDRAGETIAVIDDPDEPPEEGDHDPDLEENGAEDDFTAHPVNGPGCEISDPGGAGESEDEEEGDDAGQCTEDEVSFGDPGFGSRGPGCPISDPDKAVDDDPCDEPDQERELEQMVDDVPMLPIYSLDYDQISDQRVKLGYSNLMTSFISCGGEVRSADTGGVLVTQFEAEEPGVPV